MIRGLILLVALTWIFPAMAMKSKIKMEKEKARYIKRGDGLFTALDLKQRKVTFAKADIRRCESSLLRVQGSLEYSCTLDLPTTGEKSRLVKHLSPRSYKVRFGDTVRPVRVKVAKNAKSVTLNMRFDQTGMDLDRFELNSDFFDIYDKSAMVFLSKALTAQDLHIKVLESKKTAEQD